MAMQKRAEKHAHWAYYWFDLIWANESADLGFKLGSNGPLKPNQKTKTIIIVKITIIIVKIQMKI